jgi:hypothetical protein
MFSDENPVWTEMVIGEVFCDHAMKMYGGVLVYIHHF